MLPAQLGLCRLPTLPGHSGRGRTVPPRPGRASPRAPAPARTRRPAGDAHAPPAPAVPKPCALTPATWVSTAGRQRRRWGPAVPFCLRSQAPERRLRPLPVRRSYGAALGAGRRVPPQAWRSTPGQKQPSRALKLAPGAGRRRGQLIPQVILKP